MIWQILTIINTVFDGGILIALAVGFGIAYKAMKPMLQLKKHTAAIPVVTPDILKELNLR